MQFKTVKTAQRKRSGLESPDPRFAALARLLARDLAKKHFEQEKGEKKLKASHRGEYDSDSPRKDQS